MFNFANIKEVNIMQPSKRREGCRLTEVKRVAEDGSMVFVFVEDATKDQLQHREFVPKRGDNQSDTDFKKNVGLNVSRIAHIARAYMTEEEFNKVSVADPDNLSKVAENWKTITGIVGKFLQEKIKAGADMTCALKVILNKNNKDGKYYTGLPAVPPFVSTANHPKEFRYDPKYDLFELPQGRPDTELPTQQQGTPGTTSTPSPAAGATANSGSEADF
jgi:hypothetical protein